MFLLHFHITKPKKSELYKHISESLPDTLQEKFQMMGKNMNFGEIGFTVILLFGILELKIHFGMVYSVIIGGYGVEIG